VTHQNESHHTFVPRFAEPELSGCFSSLSQHNCVTIALTIAVHSHTLAIRTEGMESPETAAKLMTPAVRRPHSGKERPVNGR
jgi:hypothetical protein